MSLQHNMGTYVNGVSNNECDLRGGQLKLSDSQQSYWMDVTDWQRYEMSHDWLIILFCKYAIKI